MRSDSQEQTGVQPPDVSPSLGASNRPHHIDAVIVFGAVMLALGVRSYRLSDRSLWLDEAFTWRLVEFPMAEMWERITHDNSPPLYYFILKGWISLAGSSPFALRFPSVLFGAITVWAMYGFSCIAFGAG